MELEADHSRSSVAGINAYLNTGPTSPSLAPNLNAWLHGVMASAVPSENEGIVT